MTLRRMLRLSAEEAGAALRPSFVDGKWRQPLLSSRRAVMLKKRAQAGNLVGKWIVGHGGWLPEWDKPNKHHVMRPPKGHKNERNVHERVAKIQAALEKMPQKLEEHRKAIKSSKPLQGLELWLSEKDEEVDD
uniref:Uncharacterized protein AlNc14C153G7558 n=1 Tax=Albugo laibachii Nc14 TaxID=890382 RepID=F0WM55_9STRA|nr:conserved hypothetical protein [Albugo laibachii Nc14]|eukprot:CCA22383.1 conserved hypothetical protein [Albugo laibachii Nc14]